MAGGAKTYRRVLELQPEQNDARFDLAQVELRHEEYAAAAGEFRALIERASNDAGAHAWAGSGSDGAGPGEAAHVESLAALAIDPRLRSALEGAAEVELSGGISHMPSSTCKRHSRRKTMGRRQQLALAYLQSGHPERAAEQLRAAMRLDPKNAGPHTLLSQVESAQGDLSAGRGGAGGAVKLAPGDADGWNNLGCCTPGVGGRMRRGRILRGRWQLRRGMWRRRRISEGWMWLGRSGKV